MSIPSPEFVLKRVGEPVIDLDFWTFQHESMLLSAYGGKGGIDIWNLKTRRSAFYISSDCAMLSVHGFDSGDLLTLDKEGNLNLVDVKDGKSVSKLHLTIPNVAFCKAAPWLSNSAKHIVGIPGEIKSSVNIWDLDQEQIIAQIIPGSEFKLGMPWCIKLLGREHPKALIGYEDGSMICWDVMEKKILSKAIGLFSDPVMCFDSLETEDSSIFGISGSVNDLLIKWSAEHNKKNDEITNFLTLRKHKLINEGLSTIKIRRDNKTIATGGWDYKIRIFSWKTLKPLAVLEYHTGNIQTVTFSENKLLACGSNDHKISVWKIYSD